MIPEKIEECAKECFYTLADKLKLSYQMPRTRILDLEDVTEYVLRQTERTKDGEIKDYNLFRNAFHLPSKGKKELEKGIRQDLGLYHLHARYSSEDDTLRIAHCDSDKSLAKYYRKFNIELPDGKLRAKDHAMEATRAIAGETIKSLRARAMDYVNSKCYPEKFIFAEAIVDGNMVLNINSYQNINQKKYRVHMDDQSFNLLSVLDVNDMMECIGEVECAKALKGTQFEFEPRTIHDSVMCVKEGLGQLIALSRAQNGHNVFLPMMRDVCLTRYESDPRQFLKSHVYNASDPLISRPPRRIISQFFERKPYRNKTSELRSPQHWAAPTRDIMKFNSKAALNAIRHEYVNPSIPKV